MLNCVCYICVAMTADKHSEETASGAGSGGDVSCSDELCSDIFFITKVDGVERFAVVYL